MQDSELIAAARAVADRAYAPASGFGVGAALWTPDGRLYCGCNVENQSYGLTICAERSAVCSAVAAGVREFARLAVWTPCDPPGSPCGACRQVLAEFAPDLEILLAGTGDEVVRTTLTELLPRTFRFDYGPDSSSR